MTTLLRSIPATMDVFTRSPGARPESRYAQTGV
jgi:hypothetical protein